MKLICVYKDMKKGKSLIAQKERRGLVIMDGVIVDTACSLSDAPEIIQSAQINESDQIIYITGHGDKLKNTIGGLTIAEVSNYLIKAGYKGHQQIYITSCDSEKIARKLEIELIKKLGFTESSKIDVSVVSKSFGASVIIVLAALLKLQLNVELCN